MKDFFISYNKADKDWAEWMAWTLEEANYTVVIQAWDFRPGANFVLEMHTAATGTQKTIAVLSQDYLNAEYTHPEWAAAFARDPRGQERTLIPIRVRECTPTGLLAPIIYVDLVGLSEQDARIAIVGAFSGRAKPAQAPAFPGAIRPVTERVVPNRVQYPGSSAGGNLTDSIIATGAGEEISNAPLHPGLIPQPGASLSPAGRLALIQKLNGLPVQQFNMIVFALNPPAGVIPPIPASQGDRTFALLSWAAGIGGCGLPQVQGVLDAIINPQ